VAVTALSLASWSSAFGQVTFDGCVDARGLPVASIPNYGLNDIASATLDPAGRPVIYYNPRVVVTHYPATRLFFYAHECGHHALGHTFGSVGMSQEQAADCWAIRTLDERGMVTQADVAVIQRELVQFSRADWTHLPGGQRAINLAACLQMEEDRPEPKPDRRPTSKDRCEARYQSCMDDVQTRSDCMDEMRDKCVDECISQYGNSPAACRIRFCSPNASVNSNNWGSRCRTKINSDKRSCSTRLDACRGLP
jgi:hypothetical protein